MLNEDFTAEKKETMEYAPLPEDVYTVELLDVTSDERPSYDTRNLPEAEQEMETVLNFQFVLLEGEDEKGESLRGRNIFRNFVPSFLYISTKNGKNPLYQITEALQGSSLSQEQEAYGVTGSELNAMIGKQCRVSTVNKVNGEKTYSNIDRFMVAKGDFKALDAQEKEDAKVKPKDDSEV